MIALIITGAAPAQTERIEELKSQIAANPESYELGAWQVALAEQLLATLSLDGADTSVLYGVPTYEQEERVRRVAAEALQLARDAASELLRGVEAISAHPEFADRRDLQDRRSQLAVEFALIRRPLAEGRAAALSAQSGGPALRDEAVRALDHVEAATPLVEARRFATLGAFGFRDQAIDRIRSFATTDRINAIRSDSPHLARELILARARASPRGGVDKAFLETHLLAFENERPLDGLAARELDARHRFLQSASTQPPNVGPLLTFQAVRDDPSLANLVIEKCRRFATTDADPTRRSPIDRIAIGREAMADGDADRAITALRSAWNEFDDDHRVFKRLCGWDLARALREREAPQDIADAGAVLLELAQFPDESNADQALSSAIALLQWSERALSRQGAAHDDARDALRRALRLALRQRPDADDADQWRLALSNLVTGIERRDLLESITARSDAFPRARVALAWLTYADLTDAPSGAQREALAFTMLQLADQAQEAAPPASGDDETLRAAIHQARAVALAELRRFDGAAEAALAWRDLGGRAEPDAVNIVRRRVGDALREATLVRDMERAAALGGTLDALCAASFQDLLDGATARNLVDSIAIDLTDALAAQGRELELLDRISPVADRTGVTRGVGIALATGLRAAGEHAQAFQTLRDVVDASRALEISDDLYWRAWAGMLEILSDQNEDGARSERILRQIARLRAEDSALGGELIKRRIEAVERAARISRPSP